MTSEREEQPAAPQPDNGLPGRTLAAQREAMGWTVEQVADQLKLAVRQVVALEAGDYQALPSPAVTRGFVRAYAKILKLDAAPLVAQIEMDNPAPADSGAPALRRDKPTSFSEVRFPSHGRRSTLPLGWIAAVVVVAAAAGAAWHFGLIPALHGEPAAPATTTTTTTTVPAVEGTGSAAQNGAASDTLQSASVPLISVPAPAGEGAAAPAAGTPDGTAATPAGVTGTGVAPAAGAATPPAAVAPATNAAVTAPAPAPAAPAAAATGANPLVFTVSEDTWIDVRPAKGGKPLASRLVKAGSTETFDVTEPLKVVVGNTHGVKATLRGAPVALPGKTARINLQ